MNLDASSRERLLRLRSSDPTGIYDDDRRTAGTDAGKSITVTVDPLLQVRRVIVSDVDALRTPDAVRQAFEDAYRDALSRRLRPAGEVVPRPARPVARRVRRVSPTPTPERVNRHQTRYRDAWLSRTRRPGDVEGTSANGCVSVTLPPANPRGVVDADPGWLAIATRSRLGAAITEAFDDAYSRRNGS